MARSNFANLVLAVLLVAGPAALTTAYVVPPSASRIGSLAGGSSFSASVAPRVSDVRHASSSSSADMTMRLSVPSALRSFNKKFRGASAAGSSSNSRIGMSDAAAAAEPEDEKKSILQKVSIETCVSCYRANTLILGYLSSHKTCHNHSMTYRAIFANLLLDPTLHLPFSPIYIIFLFASQRPLSSRISSPQPMSARSFCLWRSCFSAFFSTTPSFAIPRMC